MKYLEFTIVFFVLGLVFTASNALAVHNAPAYRAGYGFANRFATTSIVGNQIRFEFYTVTTAPTGNNATLVTPHWMHIKLTNKANGNVITAECNTLSECNFLVGVTTGVYVMGSIPNGDYRQETSWFSGNLSFANSPYDSYYEDPSGGPYLNRFTGSSRYTHQMFTPNNAGSGTLTPVAPTRVPPTAVTTYYGTTYKSDLRPTYRVQSASANYTAQTSGTLNELSTSVGTGALPQTPFNFSASLGDGIYPAVGPNSRGYVQYPNGMQSGSIQQLAFALDNTAPNVSCTMYKYSDLTKVITNGNTSEQGSDANNKGVKLKVTVNDSSGPYSSGTLDWVVERKLTTDASWTNIGTFTGDSTVNQVVPVDLPLNPKTDDGNTSNLGIADRDYNIRVRARDIAYSTTTGLQDHYTTSTCGGTGTIRAQDTEYEAFEFKLYSDSTETDQITLSTPVVPGSTIYAVAKFRDNSLGDYLHSFKVARWKDFPGFSGPDVTNLPPPDIPAGEDFNTSVSPTQNASLLTAGNGLPSPKELEIHFDFIAPSDNLTHYAYVFIDYNGNNTGDGQITEINEFNNIRSAPYSIAPYQRFETTGGDVGAVGQVNVSQSPSLGDQSKFLLVHGAASTLAVSPFASINSYTKRLIPQAGGFTGSNLFDYFWPRLQDSMSGLPGTQGTQGTGSCETVQTTVNASVDSHGSQHGTTGTYWVSGATTWNILNPVSPATGYVIRCYGSGEQDLNSIQGYQIAGHNVFVINGNMTIIGDFKCCVDRASDGTYPDYPNKFANCNLSGEPVCRNTYVIKGNLTIRTNVANVDGVFIVGGMFKDYTDTANSIGNTLTINGAVYANNMDLGRKVVGVGGNPPVQALQVNFDPKNYFLYDNICGEDLVAQATTCYHINGRSLGWKEIAP